VQPVLLVGVAVADMQPDMVAAVVRFVAPNSSQVASCVGRTLMFLVGVAAAEVDVDVVAGVVRFVQRDCSPGRTRLVSEAR